MMKGSGPKGDAGAGAGETVMMDDGDEGRVGGKAYREKGEFMAVAAWLARHDCLRVVVPLVGN
ncbi:hypothetical protein E4U55_001514 [Claviceps digitariae]|nr:hypothetical protein E4U55_001514 [Claviceps digitariae]